MILVGREVPLSAGRAALNAASAGRGSLVLLTGEAGIGKTSVAQALAGEAAANGFTVRWGACWEGSGTALAPWVEALRGSGDACAKVAERLAGDGSGDDPLADLGASDRARDRLFAEVIDALRAAADESPQLLVLEDLHWADTATRLLLRALVSASANARLLTLATCRDDEIDAGDPMLALGGATDRLPLLGLDEKAVGDLLREVLSTEPTDADAREVHQRTGGNPLFVTQLARLVSSGSSGDLPAGVRDVLTRRLARLSTGCVEALGAAAVLGQEFDPKTIAAMLGHDDATVLVALDEASHARIADPVRSRPGTWAFAHALVQTTRYQGLGSSERARLHTAACEALSALGAPPGVLAFHAARGRYGRDDPAPARLSLAAGAEAQNRFAVDEALTHFDRALRQAPPGPDGQLLRARAWLGIGTGRLRQGDDEAAGDAFERCASLARSLGDTDLVAQAALGFGAGLTGFEVRMQDPRQIALLDEAAGALDASSTLRAPVLARLSLARWSADTPDRRLEVANEALALAREHGDDRSVAIALSSRSDALAGPDNVDDRVEIADEVVAIGRQLNDLGTELLGRRLRAAALLERCDVPGFDAEVDAFERTAARLGDPLYSWYVPLWRGTQALTQGRIAEARACIEEVRAIGQEAGSTNASLLAQVQELYVAMVSEDRLTVTAGMEVMLGYIGDMIVNAGSGAPMTIYTLLHTSDDPRAPTMTRRMLDQVDELIVDAEWLCAMAPLADLVHELDLVDDVAVLRALISPYRGLAVVEGICAALRGPIDRWLALLAAMDGDESATLDLIETSLELSSRMGVLVHADAQHSAAVALRRLDVTRWADRADALDARSYAAYAGVGLPPPPDPIMPKAARSARSPSTPAAATTGPPADRGIDARLAREGESWAFTWGGTTTRVRHVKGVADLAVLLGRPGREVHVRELAGVDGQLPTEAGDRVLDETAVARYRTRLAELEDDLDEADRHNDSARSARLAAERDALVDELTGAFGLGGRSRRLGADTDERIRKAVTARVRAAIGRVDALHPALGRHLRNSVRTGLWCSYQPEHATTWTVDPGLPPKDAR